MNQAVDHMRMTAMNVFRWTVPRCAMLRIALAAVLLPACFGSATSSAFARRQDQPVQDPAGDAPATQEPATEQAAAPRAEDEVDMVDGRPFDRIYLDDFNRNETLDIVPLLKPPSKPFPEKEVLVFELIDEQGILLEVPFANVVNFRTFNDLLLEEAEAHIEAGKYAAAFRNLLFVYDRSDKDPALADKLKRVLFLDAKQNYENGQYGLALSMFEDLFSRDPRFSIDGIDKTALELILDCYDGLLKQHAEANPPRWPAIRGLLDSVAAKYGDLAAPLREPWNERLAAQNRTFQAEAREFLENENYLEARLAAGRALQVLPQDESSLALMQEVVIAYPLLFVGVSQPALNPDPQRVDDWASRRVGRLTQRRIMEMAGFTDEGGRYVFPNGRFELADELGQVWRFILASPGEQAASFGVPPLTAHELASLLIAWADPLTPGHHVPWARLVEKVSVLDASTVEIRLRVPFVRPEALLQLPYSMPGQPAQNNGPYRITNQDEKRTLFQANDRYPKPAGLQLPEIVEWTCDSPSAAVEALLRGDVDVVDRIPSADLVRLRETPGIEVRSYAVPTVHMLVPNPRNEFMKQAMFRIGLLRTIDRERIVKEMVCGGLAIDGTEMIDSPFPVGTSDNDQIAYAVDPSIRPGVSNLLLGQLLVNGEKRRQEDVLIRKGANEADVPLPDLVLAFPKNEIASITCNAIASQWRQIGLKTTLLELPPGQTRPADDNYDFLYLEVACTEPLADADFLFGSQGAVKHVNATVEQIVRRVNTSSSWRQTSSSLRQLHRQVLNSVAVLPLFQVREHFAWRSSVRGIGRDLIFLYQQVDRWSIGNPEGNQP